MTEVSFQAEQLMPNHLHDLRLFATIDGGELVRCRVAKEVFGDCLGTASPTQSEICIVRPAIEGAFRTMIAVNDSRTWIDGRMRRREFVLSSDNFSRYCPLKVPR
jgi:hypothetical protein